MLAIEDTTQRGAVLQIMLDHHKGMKPVARLADRAYSTVQHQVDRLGCEKRAWGSGSIGPATKPAQGQKPKKESAVIGPNSASVVGPATEHKMTIEQLAERHHLDLDDWEPFDVKANVWQGMRSKEWGNEPLDLHQLTVRFKRRVPLRFVFPARADGPVRARKHRKPMNRGYTLTLCVGDQQAPFQNVAVHQALLGLIADAKPDHGLMIGDTTDQPDVSRHVDDPRWDVPIQECVNVGYLLCADYVTACTRTKWKKLLGNHDVRMEVYLLGRAKKLWGIRRADVPGRPREGSVLDIDYLLRLDELGIELVRPNGSYAHAQSKIGGDALGRHGWLTGKDAGMASLVRLRANLAIGHTHRQSIRHMTVYDRNQKAHTYWAAETGCLCRIEDGLGYAIDPDWVNGALMVVADEKGRTHPELIQWDGKRLWWRGRSYT